MKHSNKGEDHKVFKYSKRIESIQCKLRNTDHSKSRLLNRSHLKISQIIIHGFQALDDLVMRKDLGNPVLHDDSCISPG